MRTAPTPPAKPDPIAASSFQHFILLVAATLASVAAFWILLCHRFSPENYEARPMLPYTTEFGWLGAVLFAAVCGLVAARRNRESWRRLAFGALPLTAASLLILIKWLVGAPIQMYDMLLFCLAGGGTTCLCVRASVPAASHPHARPESDAGRILRIAVWGAVVALALYQFHRQVWYLNNLALGYADCGENARLMFNSFSNPHELFLRVNPDKPLCYDHIDFGIVPFLPVWLFWPDLRLTIILQIVSVFGAAVPLFFIAKRAFESETAALLVALAWVLYPSTSQFIYSASYGFRWGNVCLLMYFVALALWWRGRAGWALTVAIWAIAIKEEAAIVVGMFGLYLALFTPRKITGAILLAAAFGYFLLAVSVLVPLISGHNYVMTSLFHEVGGSKLEILLSPVARPRAFWGHLFDPRSLYFAAVLLAPLLFLPLRKPAILLVGLLTFVFCSMNPTLRNICYWYQAGLLPVVFWAFVAAVQQERDASRRFASLAGAVVSCAAVSLFLGAQPWSKETMDIPLLPGRTELIDRVRPLIDPDDRLFTTQRAGAQFITHRYLYLDPPVPDSMDSVLIDLRDSWRRGADPALWLQKVKNLQHTAEANPHLHLVSAEDGLLLYSRHGTPLDAQQLVERPALPPHVSQQRSELRAGVNLVGFTLEPMPPLTSPPMDRVRVTGFFTISAPTNADLAVRCIVGLEGPGGHDSYEGEFQPLGQGIWPVSKWEANKFYADSFVVMVPAGLTRDISSVTFTPMSPDPPP
ncbi:MAG TPA: DUF2079 domain-containing protein [Verrucomicrobiae bacterium]|nr:DUF2079 domain-containing protein [Verrucomicrobiae bacterium]